MRTVTVLPAYVLLHGSRSEYRWWLRHINLGLGKTNDGSDPAERHVSMGDGTKDSRRTRSTALPANSRLPRYGDGRPGIQPDRAEASPINPKKLVTSSV